MRIWLKKSVSIQPRTSLDKFVPRLELACPALESFLPVQVCGGRGHCEPWDPNDVAHPVAFCKCEEWYAGPECRTKRKSQVVAFVCSVFGGLFGSD